MLCLLHDILEVNDWNNFIELCTLNGFFVFFIDIRNGGEVWMDEIEVNKTNYFDQFDWMHSVESGVNATKI